MAHKMSQEFPTASLDITKDFHILHSAYVYICYSIIKAEKEKKNGFISNDWIQKL